MLENGERVEADAGYVGEAPTYVICPKAITSVKVLTEEKNVHKEFEADRKLSTSASSGLDA